MFYQTALEASGKIAAENDCALFDFDGTLVDSLPVWNNAGELYLASLGIKAEPNLGRILFNMNMNEAAFYLIEKYGIDKTEGQVIEGVNETIFLQYKNFIPLKKGALEFLRKLTQLGTKCSVVTASDRALVEPAFYRLGLESFIDGIFTCTELGTSKEAPDIFYTASSFHNSLPEKTIVFEDALVPVCTALAAGFTTAAIFDDYNKNDEDELRKTARFYFNEWA